MLFCFLFCLPCVFSSNNVFIVVITIQVSPTPAIEPSETLLTTNRRRLLALSQFLSWLVHDKQTRLLRFCDGGWLNLGYHIRPRDLLATFLRRLIAIGLGQNRELIFIVRIIAHQQREAAVSLSLFNLDIGGSAESIDAVDAISLMLPLLLRRLVLRQLLAILHRVPALVAVAALLRQQRGADGVALVVSGPVTAVVSLRLSSILAHLAARLLARGVDDSGIAIEVARHSCVEHSGPLGYLHYNIL